MEIKRRNFQGVLNILSFNRHFYIAGIAAMGLLFASCYFMNWPGILFRVVIAAFLYGLLMPLVVSAYVYDFSGFYKFDWLDKIVKDDGTTKQLVNINAGFDETSFIIHHKFPSSDLHVFDFYNAKQHTEPAIRRARKVTQEYPTNQPIRTDHIPLPDQAVDIVFLLSAVHEIRSQEEKIIFLKECHRICKPGAKVIMVEHLRDFPNFAAFSIGFTHFFSRNTWKKAFAAAGFPDFKEKKFTAFMSVFTCTK